MRFDERPRPQPLVYAQNFPEPGRQAMWVRHDVVDPETGVILAMAWVWAYGHVGAVAGAEGLARTVRTQIPESIVEAIQDTLTHVALKALRQEWQEAKGSLGYPETSRRRRKEGET